MKENQHEQHEGNILSYFRQTMRIMRLSLFFMVVGTGLAFSATTYSQSTKLSVNLKDATVGEVIKAIEEQSEFLFLYQEGQVDLNRRVTIQAEEKKLQEILDEVFKGTDNIYIVSDRQVVIGKAPRKTLEAQLTVLQKDLKTVIEQPQQREITGKVTDSSGDPLPGATVLVKGTTIGTVTDANGNFSLRIPANAQILQISFVGMKTQEIPIDNRTTFNVVLEEEAIGLEEVVAVGYGVQKKATVTGALSTIDTKSLVQSPQANISNSLVGRLSGVIAKQPFGEPGGDASIIRIRGIGTFSGSADPLVMVDGVESLNYNNLDPNEIENITILKDASATAVYGVRGANGVILITTKRGAKGSPTISFSSNVAIVSFVDLRKNLGSYEWAKTFNEALKYNSYITGTYTPKFNDEQIEHFRIGDDPIFYPNTDWISLMFRPASLQSQANVNLNGGTDALKYFVNIGAFDQQGLFNNTQMEDYDSQMTFRRYNFRSNFDVDITKRFSVNINMSSQIEQRHGPIVRVTYLVDRIYNAPPNISPGIIDGKIINVYDVFGGNPLEQLLGTGIHNQYSNYLTVSSRFNYDLNRLLKGLKAHGTLSYWNFMDNDKRYSKPVQTYKPVRIDNGDILFAPQKEDTPFSFAEWTAKKRRIYLEIGLDYEKQLAQHSFSGMILYNQSKLYDPTLAYVIPNGYQGIVGRVTYDYKRKYLAEFNMGFNGTENFAPGKRFGFFPAYSLGWVVSEESFFPKNDYVTFLKIRGSYGEVGNDKIGGARFLYRPSSYVYSGSYNFGEVGSTLQAYPASEEGLLGNPNLTWERSKKSNIGVEINLWENKIKIITDYFQEKRDNILTTPKTTPEIVGVSFPAQNFGRMKNYGYEIEIGLNDHISNFNYWTKVNYTHATNRILFQDEVNPRYPYLRRTGQRYGQMYGLVVEGFYNTWEEVNDANRPRSLWNSNLIMPGDFRYKDVNGDGIINGDDMVPVGYPDFPEIIYGLSFGGEYKGFDFSVLFQGASHVSRYTYITSVRPFENDLMCQAYIPKLAWDPEKLKNGDPIKLPHLSAQQVQIHDYQSSTFMIQDASYLRLKNAEIGYSFNIGKFKNISSFRAYINGNNLLTWHGLYPGEDPEQVSQGDDWAPYPNTRVINIGFNIKF